MVVHHVLLLPLLAPCSVLVTTIFIVDVVRMTNLPSACEMTWSWPVYTPVTWRSSVSHPKYHYKQARFVAVLYGGMNEELFDFVDFHDGITGLTGYFVTDQAFIP
ncbi:unnamed protein product [Peronospora destructor]|uniref:Secreted protein n=1 Tax=Peronospora destructor TaxID=86335 RepID=A0AAV0TVV7_9STRA|nr:unnamed protein product [Peronospora destructor]